ncbi:MAG: c-type cytochrome [Gemmatimonadaceae bacterium]
MRKPVRIALRIVGGLIGLVLLVVLGASVVSHMRLRKHYAVTGKVVPQPTDSASVARGKALATLYGCTGCHTPNLAGQQLIDAFPFAKLATSNLTRGEGGVAGTYSDADWDRAVRHGVKRDGTPLFLMPSNAFNRMSDDEFGRLLAYVKSVPAVDRTPTPRVIYPLARMLHTFGVGEPLVPAELIDHTAQRNPQPAPGPTLAYGEYIAGACKFCHGENLGGRPVGGEASAPPSPPIGPNSVVSRWTEAQFVQTMHTGTTPEGRKLRPEFMPWPAVGALHDDELHALYTYLHQLPQQTAAK